MYIISYDRFYDQLTLTMLLGNAALIEKKMIKKTKRLSLT